MLMDYLGIFDNEGDSTLYWDATHMNAGTVTSVVDTGLGTKGKQQDVVLGIRFGAAGGVVLAGGTSVAFTITTGTTTAGTGTTSEVVTLTLAQMNAGYLYNLPSPAARYAKVVGAAATGVFSGAGQLGIWLTPVDFAPATPGY